MNENEGDHAVRNYRDDDFQSFVRLRNAAARLAADGAYNPPQALRTSLGRLDYSPESDLFISEVDGAAVGYLDLNAEPRIERVVLDSFVDPAYRQTGLAHRLYCRAVPRARQLGAKLAHVSVRDDNAVAREVLSAAGFRPVRRFLEMQLDLSALPEDGPHPRYPLCPLGAGEEDQLAVVQNRAFTGAWGYCPNTVEGIRHATAGDSREGIFLAWDGDRAAGYFWTTAERATADSEVKGRLSMIGVDPDYQGHGIGEELTLAAMRHFKGKGLRTARLTVDSDNSRAHELYVSIGFEETDASIWYEKRLD